MEKNNGRFFVFMFFVLLTAAANFWQRPLTLPANACSHIFPEY